MNPLDPREPRNLEVSLDTDVAGMSCREVLLRLNDFLDGDLSPDEVQRVTAHLAGCHTCEQFGGRVGALIQSLRATMTTAPDDVPPAAAARLRARLAAEQR